MPHSLKSIFIVLFFSCKSICFAQHLSFTLTAGEFDSLGASSAIVNYKIRKYLDKLAVQFPDSASNYPFEIEEITFNLASTKYSAGIFNVKTLSSADGIYTAAKINFISKKGASFFLKQIDADPGINCCFENIVFVEKKTKGQTSPAFINGVTDDWGMYYAEGSKPTTALCFTKCTFKGNNIQFLFSLKGGVDIRFDECVASGFKELGIEQKIIAKRTIFHKSGLDFQPGCNYIRSLHKRDANEFFGINYSFSPWGADVFYSDSLNKVPVKAIYDFGNQRPLKIRFIKDKTFPGHFSQSLKEVELHGDGKIIALLILDSLSVQEFLLPEKIKQYSRLTLIARAIYYSRASKIIVSPSDFTLQNGLNDFSDFLHYPLVTLIDTIIMVNGSYVWNTSKTLPSMEYNEDKKPKLLVVGSGNTIINVNGEIILERIQMAKYAFENITLHYVASEKREYPAKALFYWKESSCPDDASFRFTKCKFIATNADALIDIESGSAESLCMTFKECTLYGYAHSVVASGKSTNDTITGLIRQ
jgi:hypothetical protein